MLIEQLKADYARFPKQQSYQLYAADVYFKDPLNSFRGVGRYQQMIGFIDRWFTDVTLDLHHIQQDAHIITTRWTLSWTAPAPWRPRMQISGRSELTLNPEGLVQSHIDYWDCSRLDVLKQLFSLERRATI